VRVPVDINDSWIQDLDRLAKRQGRPRAALIREAIADYLRRYGEQGIDDAFGLRGHRKIDGLAYQDTVRSEW